MRKDKVGAGDQLAKAHSTTGSYLPLGVLLAITWVMAFSVGVAL